METLVLSILSNALYNIISSGYKDLLLKKSNEFDFLLQKKDGESIAVELKSKAPTSESLISLKELVDSKKPKVDKLILVTPTSPTQNQLEEFIEVFGEENGNLWVSANDLPKELGLKASIDLDPQTLLTESQESKVRKDTENITVTAKNELRELIGLQRQLSHENIKKLIDIDSDFSEKLKIGQRVSNVTVVFSDLKNFSSLVKCSRPEDLTETMTKYYSRSRNLVWQHQGMLDKFIGDSILAVFNYPFDNQKACINAIEFAFDLIEVWKNLSNDLKEEINENVETGTRIGIATGDIWVLDISSNLFEISFVGDVINLASRLQENCLVDGVLIDNKTKTKVLLNSPEFWNLLFPEKMFLPTNKVKGQLFEINCWNVKPIKS